MSQFPISMPGIGAGLTLTARYLFNVTLSGPGHFAASGWRIDGFSTRDTGNSPVTQIRPGLILGQITTTGSTVFTGTGPTQYMYGASFIGSITAAITTGSTTFTFNPVAAASELVRRNGSSAGTFLITGAPTASGTVVVNTLTYSAVNTSTGAVTITAPLATFFAGSLVSINDGTQIPLTFYCFDPYPISMVDVNLANQETPIRYIPITNQPIVTSNLINYPSQATYPALTAYIKAKLRLAAPALTFDDDIYPIITNPTP